MTLDDWDHGSDVASNDSVVPNDHYQLHTVTFPLCRCYCFSRFSVCHPQLLIDVTRGKWVEIPGQPLAHLILILLLEMFQALSC